MIDENKMPEQLAKEAAMKIVSAIGGYNDLAGTTAFLPDPAKISELIQQTLTQATTQQSSELAAMQKQRDMVLHMLGGGTFSAEELKEAGLGEGILIEQRHKVAQQSSEIERLKAQAVINETTIDELVAQVEHYRKSNETQGRIRMEQSDQLTASQWNVRELEATNAALIEAVKRLNGLRNTMANSYGIPDEKRVEMFWSADRDCNTVVSAALSHAPHMNYVTVKSARDYFAGRLLELEGRDKEELIAVDGFFLELYLRDKSLTSSPQTCGEKGEE